MRLIGEKVLSDAGKKNASLRKALAGWKLRIEPSTYASLNDLRVDFPQADGVTLPSRTVVTVFNVKGNDFRLLAIIRYPISLVAVLEVLTHAEYDKQLWKKRY